MSPVSQISAAVRVRRLVLSAAGATLLVACGQKGPLTLPTGEAAAGRATLPQTLSPAAAPASAPPVTGTASPVRTP